MPLTRRHLLISTAATAACGAMPAAAAIAAVETAPAGIFDLFPPPGFRILSRAEMLALLDDPSLNWARPPSPDDYELDDLDDDGRLIKERT